MADLSTATIFLLDSLLCVDWRDRCAKQLKKSITITQVHMILVIKLRRRLVRIRGSSVSELTLCANKNAGATRIVTSSSYTGHTVGIHRTVRHSPLTTRKTVEH